MRAMQVTSYNIAHANDTTYKRQRLVLVEGQVLATQQEAGSIGSSVVGSGATSGDAVRVRNALVENRIQIVTSSAAEWDYKQTSMSQIESIIGEPSDTGLENDLDKFWNAWETVSNNPEEDSLRTSLLEDTTSLCERIQYQYGQLSDMTDDLNLEAEDIVDQINLMSKEIANLNNEIGALSTDNEPVNDLLNRRDALVLELAKYTDVTQCGEDSDSFIISIGGHVLVQGTLVNELAAVPNAGGQSDIVWAKDSDPVDVTGGKLKAVLDLRDEIVPGYMSALDDLATELVSAVNAVHVTGLTSGGAVPGDFFKAGTTAANISLDDNIIDHPELVAVSSADPLIAGTGNGDIAAAIAGLKTSHINASGTTINGMYETFVGNIGSTSAAAETQSDAAALSLQQFVNQQQAQSGVSLDEELTNMIKFQQAYNAASKVLTVMDEMLSILMQTGA